MKIHCLGTVGFHPNSTRHTSCYFLPESGVLLDAGTGVFRLAPLIQTESIDILLSHAHLDHTAGLTFLLDVFYARPVQRVTIWGEAAKLRAVRECLFHELIFPVELEAEYREIDDLGEFKIGCQGDVEVTWRGQNHPGGSVGYRLDWIGGQSKRLTYLTDTTGDVSDDAIAWYGGSDLMMHECYFRDSAREWAEKTGHSWTSRVVEVARLATPKKLMVTHLNPLESAGHKNVETEVELDRLESELGMKVLVAEDMLEVDF